MLDDSVDSFILNLPVTDGEVNVGGLYDRFDRRTYDIIVSRHLFDVSCIELMI